MGIGLPGHNLSLREVKPGTQSRHWSRGHGRMLFTGFLNYFSFISQTSLPMSSTAHSRPGFPTLTINQDSVPLTSLTEKFFSWGSFSTGMSNWQLKLTLMPSTYFSLSFLRLLKWELLPLGSCIWILDLWLVALFEQVMEPLGPVEGWGLTVGGIPLGAGFFLWGTGRCKFWGLIAWLHLLFSLLPVNRWNVFCQFSALTTRLACLPLHYGLSQ